MSCSKRSRASPSRRPRRSTGTASGRSTRWPSRKRYTRTQRSMPSIPGERASSPARETPTTSWPCRWTPHRDGSPCSAAAPRRWRPRSKPSPVRRSSYQANAARMSSAASGVTISRGITALSRCRPVSRARAVRHQVPHDGPQGAGEAQRAGRAAPRSPPPWPR